jgi:hypothetical protein
MAREQRQRIREDEKAQEAADRDVTAQLAAIRHHPTVPEVGATLPEVRVACEQQRGEFI